MQQLHFPLISTPFKVFQVFSFSFEKIILLKIITKPEKSTPFLHCCVGEREDKLAIPQGKKLGWYILLCFNSRYVVSVALVLLGNFSNLTLSAEERRKEVMNVSICSCIEEGRLF